MAGSTDRAGNVVGVDPHKRTLSATVVDERGGIVATAHYNVSGDGHRALEAWVRISANPTTYHPVRLKATTQFGESDHREESLAAA
jgi:hypothetical protein